MIDVAADRQSALGRPYRAHVGIATGWIGERAMLAPAPALPVVAAPAAA